MGRLRTLHGLLAVQSIVIVLLSVNRLSNLTLGYVAPNEFLRWYDLNNMLILPLISVIAFYVLKKHLETWGAPTKPRIQMALNIAFIVGIYLLAASYGDHEVTNYLNTRYCIPEPDAGMPDQLCEIISFNDDEFSHWVFFAGFVLINAALMLYQMVFPHQGDLGVGDRVLLVINALFIAAGIFANLAFEEIGLDLYVVALLAGMAIMLWWQNRNQPMLLYYMVAFALSLVATAITKLIG